MMFLYMQKFDVVSYHDDLNKLLLLLLSELTERRMKKSNDIRDWKNIKCPRHFVDVVLIEIEN